MQPGLATSVEAIKSEFLQLEREAEIRTFEAREWACQKELKLSLAVEQKTLTKDLRQKARVKWAIDGDENTKFFHAVVRGRKKKNDVKGMLINGTWIEEPAMAKVATFDFFSQHYEETDVSRPTFTNQRFNKLNDEEIKAIEVAFTDEEIRNAVGFVAGVRLQGPTVSTSIS